MCSDTQHPPLHCEAAIWTMMPHLLPTASNVGVLAWQKWMGILIPEGRAWASLRKTGFALLWEVGFFTPCDTTSQKKTPQVREPWYRGGDYLFSFPHFIKNSKSIHEHNFVVLKDSTQKNWRYLKKKLVFNGSKGKATQVSKDAVKGMNTIWSLHNV